MAPIIDMTSMIELHDLDEAETIFRNRFEESSAPSRSIVATNLKDCHMSPISHKWKESGFFNNSNEQNKPRINASSNKENKQDDLSVKHERHNKFSES